MSRLRPPARLGSGVRAFAGSRPGLPTWFAEIPSYRHRSPMPRGRAPMGSGGAHDARHHGVRRHRLLALRRDRSVRRVCVSVVRREVRSFPRGSAHRAGRRSNSPKRGRCALPRSRRRHRKGHQRPTDGQRSGGLTNAQRSCAREVLAEAGAAYDRRKPVKERAARGPPVTVTD
jgi:hypothetical protein